ncbi:MAG TPA: DegT/DnrJ/EryC1/StrS family aminotransferase [Acidobacteriaceae bacterium]|nr:DegT/DnrJ/EryC1/StrS family aminotransferase [Acidobacteriaceae bacterium]
MTKDSSTPVPMLDFSRQYAALRPRLLEAVTKACDSLYYVLGPEVAAFETAAATACGTTFGVGCGSGTDALWLAMAAAGIGPGDRVLTTPFSFFATVSSILRAGATPVLADIDPVTFNLSPAACEELLKREKIKAILPVHLYGQCADWNAFQDLKDRYGVLLIEDAAQAFGATWQSRPAGSLGDAAAFSFYPTKNLNAMGDAGLVTTCNDALAERMKMLRTHGMRRRYYHDEVGANSRLDTIQAAILLVKLQFIEEWNERRRELAENYELLFKDAAGLISKDGGLVLPSTDARGVHVYHQYVIRAPRRDDLRAFLTEKKIGTEIYYPVPLHLQQALKSLGYKRGDFPESERAADEVLALPMYAELREDEQEIVVDAIAEFYGN